jgi:hypothetical protein
MLTNPTAIATTQAMALAMTWRAAKWAMGRVTRAILTNAIATIAIVLVFTVTAAVFIAAAATTIAQHRCPQHSHCIAIVNLFDTAIKWRWHW